MKNSDKEYPNQQITKLTGYKYLVAKNIINEGIFIITDEDGQIGKLDMNTYMCLLREAKQAGVEKTFRVFGRIATYCTKNMMFYQFSDVDSIYSYLGI
jgi:hypothetical protein